MQYIGIVFAIGVWIYFEFYRIPQIKNLIPTELQYNEQWSRYFKPTRDSIQDAIDEIWEKLDEFEQAKDVGTKTSPKAVSRN